MRCETTRGGRSRLIDFEQALERGDQIGARAGFADKTLRAQQAHSRFGLGSAFLHSEEQNFGLGRDAAYLKRSGYAIHHRHVDIQKHQFRVQRFHLIERLLAVRGFAANRQRIGNQELAHGVARNTMVVDK